MNSNDEKIRAAIAEEAGEWFVANDEAPLDAKDSAALSEWFKTSPVHIEEFLGVSAIARDLKEARTDPEYSLEAILARARAEDDTAVQPLWPRVIDAVQGSASRRWLPAAVAMAACAVLSLGLLLTWNLRPIQRASAPEGITALHLETRHGEQLTHRLADNSILHLNTDSAVTVRYSKKERLVMLTSGQADFEVAHEPGRAFRVIAGSAEVVDLGTKFDVRLEQGSTVVTVVEGRVAVGPSPMLEKLGTNSSQNHPPRFVQLSADEQVRVSEGEWPVTPSRSMHSAPRLGCIDKSYLITNRSSVSRPNTIATLKSRSRSPPPRYGILKSVGSSPPTTRKHSLRSCAVSRACGSR